MAQKGGPDPLDPPPPPQWIRHCKGCSPKYGPRARARECDVESGYIRSMVDTLWRLMSSSSKFTPIRCRWSSLSVALAEGQGRIRHTAKHPCRPKDTKLAHKSSLLTDFPGGISSGKLISWQKHKVSDCMDCIYDSIMNGQICWCVWTGPPQGPLRPLHSVSEIMLTVRDT